MSEAGDRMFGNLPAVFRRSDGSGDAARLLDALEQFFFTSPDRKGDWRGLGQLVEEIPALFRPLGAGQGDTDTTGTPDRFLHWLAAWLAFTPHAQFSPERLRHILSGIIPMYGYRGTKGYLLHLLALCFEDELALVHVDDRPQAGFAIGEASLGVDTWLATGRPFFFRVVVEVCEPPAARPSSGRLELLLSRMHAVIDFAKPAHTAYEIEWRTHPREEPRSGQPHA